MRKLLPAFLLFIICGLVLINPDSASAQLQQQVASVAAEGSWVQDSSVTFTGKNAARAGQLLDWTLHNYEWTIVQGGAQNPLTAIWVVIRNIVYALLILVVLATAFILIITRGRSVRTKRFLPRFIGVILLITLSFAIIQLIYQFFDLIQGFFLKDPITPGAICPDDCITQKHLLYVGWEYVNFIGLRRIGLQFEESAFISLLLVKMTALTYYVMIGILWARKIILWFFIIVSPIFPLLLLYYPIRNTGKIWIGEFFRWLLYGPLFAIFLSGLVGLWRTSIPMRFDFSQSVAGAVEYPTAINILLGGPKQLVSLNNSVNLVDTFALYLFCLMMLWGVIIVPWILLQIFLDYAKAFNVGESPLFKQLLNFTNKQPPPSFPPSPAPSGAGRGRDLPTMRDFIIPEMPKGAGMARDIPIVSSVSTVTSAPLTKLSSSQNELLQLTNLSVPTMRDIATYETQLLSKSDTNRQDIQRVTETLQKIASPQQTLLSTDKTRYSEMREKIIQESMQGNPIATSILHASNILIQNNSSASTQVENLSTVLEKLSNPQSIKIEKEKERYVELHDRLIKEKESGNPLATTIINNISSTTNQSISQVQQTMQQLAKPDMITSPIQRNQITALKETLTKEGEKNNQLATLVMSSLNQATSQSDVEKVYEKLVQESKSGNQLASQVLKQQELIHVTETLQQLNNPQAVTSLGSKTQLVALKERLENEKQQNNPLAITILTSMEKPLDAETVTQLHETLLRESQNGNSLATEILKVSSTKEQGKVELEELKKQILAAKEKGDQVAIAMLSQTTPGQTQVALPQTNRIQPVSIEDYESVKKMWQENYKNLDIPTTSSGETQQRSAWINSDISDIDEAINLLSSTDQEQVAIGMEKVASILPFLLLGGFSQDEIVTYLKAKQEAAKAVLEDVKKQESDEDTFVPASTKTTQKASKQQAATVEISGQNTSSEASDFGTYSVQPVHTPEVSTSTATVSPASSTNVLQLTNLSLPTMRDIARYEVSLQSHSETSDKELTKIHTTLKNIAQPELATLSEQNTYSKVREKLSQESEQGNVLAQSILTAADTVTKSDTTNQTPEVAIFAAILERVADPSIVSEIAERQKYITMRDTIVQQSQHQDVVARELLTTVNDISRTKTESFQKLLLGLSDPQQVKEDDKRKEIISLKEYLTQESSKGNELAATILSTLQGTIGLSEVEHIMKSLRTSLENKDVVATIISKKLSMPTADSQIKKLQDVLKKGQQDGNSLASYLIQATDAAAQKENKGVLPQKNRVQKVSLEDYEAVRKMWSDNYQKMDVPIAKDGDVQSRSDWLKAEIKEIMDLIILLSSGDPKKTQKAMQQVGNILPFLLIGGFSLDEIVAYLKAKLAAAKDVLSLVEGQEETKVPLETKTQTPVKNKEAQAKIDDSTEDTEEKK